MGGNSYDSKHCSFLIALFFFLFYFPFYGYVTSPHDMGRSQSKKSSESNHRHHFVNEEKECISAVWDNLRMSSADSGLYLHQHIFYLYPELIEKFEFSKDKFGNQTSEFLTGKALREHSIRVMDALDSVIVDMLKGKDIHKQMVDIGYSHLKMGVEPRQIEKFLMGVYIGIKEKQQKKDSDQVMLAWKKFFDVLAEGFEDGLKAARDEAGKQLVACLNKD